MADDALLQPSFPEYLYPGKPKLNGGLKVYLQEIRPAQAEPYIFFENDDFVVIYDAFPKSNIHLLIMPKNIYISKISRLDPGKSDHVDVLHGMLELARVIMDHFEEKGIEIWQGFHALPSLAPLHLHLISTDFSTQALKKNIHWNSFLTAFFVDPQSVYEVLCSGKNICIDEAAYKRMKKSKTLVCPKCNQKFQSTQDIKSHWAICEEKLESLERELFLL